LEGGDIAVCRFGDVEQQRGLIDVVAAVERIALAFGGVGRLRKEHIGERIIKKALLGSENARILLFLSLFLFGLLFLLHGFCRLVLVFPFLVLTFTHDVVLQVFEHTTNS
jgi:hypothetical protein